MGRTKRVEAFCPEHLRRHLLYMGYMPDRERLVAQCAGSAKEWDVSSGNYAPPVIDLEVGTRDVRVALYEGEGR